MVQVEESRPELYTYREPCKEVCGIVFVVESMRTDIRCVSISFQLKTVPAEGCYSPLQVFHFIIICHFVDFSGTQKRTVT